MNESYFLCKLFGKGAKGVSANSGDTLIKRIKTQQWDSVVTIALVEGKNLISKDENGLSDPYVKFRLGNEKYKSRVRETSSNLS